MTGPRGSGTASASVSTSASHDPGLSVDEGRVFLLLKISEVVLKYNFQCETARTKYFML